MACVGGSISEEDSIVSIDEGVGVVQSDLVFSVVLAVSMLMAEEPALKGVSMCVVGLGSGFELMECVRMCEDMGRCPPAIIVMCSTLWQWIHRGQWRVVGQGRVEGCAADSQGRGLRCMRGSLSHQ